MGQYGNHHCKRDEKEQQTSCTDLNTILWVNTWMLKLNLNFVFNLHRRMRTFHVSETSNLELLTITWSSQPNMLGTVNHSAKNMCLWVKWKLQALLLKCSHFVVIFRLLHVTVNSDSFIDALLTHPVDLNLCTIFKWQTALCSKRIEHNAQLIFMFVLSFPVKRMVETGKEILQKNNVTDLSDVRWATFSSSH